MYISLFEENLGRFELKVYLLECFRLQVTEKPNLNWLNV